MTGLRVRRGCQNWTKLKLGEVLVETPCMGSYYPRLDGLRSLAVFSAMVFHWSHPEIWGRQVPLGWAGVELFFVLSGFLIGGILIRAGAVNVAAGTSQWFTFRAFAVRRALRIFPAFFAFLFITAVLLGVPDRAWFWYPLYGGNFRMLALGSWPAYWSHTWTLAVEEQFYLFLPPVVLFLRSAASRAVVPLLAVLSAASLAVVTYSGNVPIVPPAAFYGLLVGVTVAWGVHNDSPLLRLMPGIGIASAAGASAAWLLGGPVGASVYRILGTPALAAVVLAATGTGPFLRFLEARPLVEVGRLAYGMYLWHHAVGALLNSFFGVRPEHVIPRLGIYTAATLILAKVSWACLERPINNQKRRFPYHRLAVTPADSEPLALARSGI